MANEINEDLLPLDEFVKLPTTVDFGTINSDRFKLFVKERPWLHVGTELANEYVVVYLNKKYFNDLSNELGTVFSIEPRILSPLSDKSNEDSGITRVLNQPFLNLSGRGVIIGFVDTGIDYTKQAFKFEDGTSKILSIWDQTIDGQRPDYLYYGSVYTKDQIDAALKSEDPYSLVPTQDEDGHGTFLASVAASNETNEYIGAAPKASIIAVKLRRAHPFFIDRYALPESNPNLYESTDYLLGIKYILDQSEELNVPVVICIGMGSNGSAHDGSSLFEDYISFVAKRTGYAFITAAGNESNAKHHTQGKIAKTGSTDSISIKVGKSDTSFSLNIYGPAYDKISVGVVSPTGEVISRVPFKVGRIYTEKLIFENTEISIRYTKSIDNRIFIRLLNATQGIWDIRLFGDTIISGNYYAWLPITGQISEFVEFLKPVPEYTIVYPATALRTITVGAYDSNTNSLYVSSSWGPTRLPQMAPDFVAPGVNVKGIYPTGYGTMTGTSVSAAVTAGAAALLMEWGIIQGNLPSMSGDLVRSLLISGCDREDGMEYPNIKWGYGRLNLFDTFTTIKESASQ